MKAVVLSSGGVDSTTCLAVAIDKYGAENVTSLSVTYGQKHSKELDCAEAVANYYGVNHKVMDLSNIYKDNSSCTLLVGNGEMEHTSYAEQINKSETGIVNTFVPFRNGLLIASAAAYAMGVYPDEEVELYLGAHSDDAAGNAYPDCSKEFTDAMYKAVYAGTGGYVKPTAPFVGLHKSDIVKIGLDLNVPYNLTWSCYEGGDIQCGTCGTCIDRKKAFELNGVEDPVAYKE
jgi:7-cyano-7-deazaguanine synthase